MPTENINWRVYERDRLYPQGVSAYLDLIKLSPSKKYPYVANYYEVMTYYHDYFWWARDADSLEKTMRLWLKDWLKNKTKRNKIFDLYKKSRIETRKVLPRLGRIYFKSSDDYELYQVYLKSKQVFLNSIIFSEYTTDLFDDFFGKIFGEELRRLTKNIISETDLSKLLQPAYVSESLIYKKIILQYSLARTVQPQYFKKAAWRFGWTMMSWDGSNELTAGRIEREVKKLKLKSFNSRKQELRQIDSFVKLIKVKRVNLIKKYNLSFSKLKSYFQLLDNFAMFHDWRKETQMRSNQIIFPALKEMARRFGIRYKDLLFYKNLEIKDLCLRRIKVDKSVIVKRQQGLTWVIRKGKVEEHLGLEAKRVLDKLVLSVIKIGKASLVNGVPASLGKVVGQVYVVKGAKEALKILKKGGILVTSMTTIDYLPAMQKAVAIVTDDGGITCHAAIVSRELGIPCVVGTKIATQVFKTGDKVEVDATKGVVKKI